MFALSARRSTPRPPSPILPPSWNRALLFIKERYGSIWCVGPYVTVPPLLRSRILLFQHPTLMPGFPTSDCNPTIGIATEFDALPLGNFPAENSRWGTGTTFATGHCRDCWKLPSPPGAFLCGHSFQRSLSRSTPRSDDTILATGPLFASLPDPFPLSPRITEAS